jgi:hypothetical protein
MSIFEFKGRKGARRAALVGGFLFVSLTAPRWGVASVGPGGAETDGPHGQVEVAGYGGRSWGGWACGPMGGAKYGGGAAAVQVAQRPRLAEEGQGFTAELQGAAQYTVAETVYDPGRDCDGCEGPFGELEPAWLGAGALTGGYEWKYFGVTAGANAMQRIEEDGQVYGPTSAAPSLELAARYPDHWRVVLGFGSPTVTDLFMPGFYAGGDIYLPDASILELRGGLFVSQPSGAAPRATAVWRIPMSDATAFRLGASGGFSEEAGLRAVYQGSAGLSVQY